MKDLKICKHTSVAIYSRFSSDMQRPASIEDQQRNCREAADLKDWNVLEDHVLADCGVSGRTMEGRDQFTSLIELATSGQAPFTGIVVDDTSRFGRNLTEVLNVVDRLSWVGVFVYFATNGMDTRDQLSRQILVHLAQQDEQHSIQLGEKVHRGMRGRVLKGFIATGIPYGYRSKYLFDSERKGRGGLPAVEAVDLEIVEHEATVVHRIFRLCANGYGFAKIARTLQAEGVPSPRAELSGKSSHWHSQTVKRMIFNPKYKGLNIWNKTKHRMNPNTHRREQVSRPSHEWEMVPNESWRIVSDELWRSAQAAYKSRASKSSPAQTGGHGRWKKAEDYIFSGLLKCAECGGNLQVFSTRDVSNRYICSRALSYGGCTQRHSVHRGALQPRLLLALKTCSTSELVCALTSKILDAENVESERRLSIPSVEQLQEAERNLDGKIHAMYQNMPNTSDKLVWTRTVSALESEYRAVSNSLLEAKQQRRPLLKETEAKVAAIELVKQFMETLEGDLIAVRSRLSVHLRPIQVSWEMCGKEKMAVLFTAINFYLAHSEQEIALPLRLTISTEYRRDREKRCTDDALEELCSGQTALSPRQIYEALHLSRTTVGRWCKAGLPHLRVASVRTQGEVRIDPTALRSWLEALSARPTEVVICPNEEYPKANKLITTMRRQNKAKSPVFKRAA